MARHRLCGSGIRHANQQRLHICQLQMADRIQAEFYYFSDIDHFKEINDTFGHSTGDQVLLELAEILKRSFRESDIIARIGGGEFAVALTDCNKETLDLVKIHLKENINDHNQDIKPASYRAWPGRCFL
jgi:diguanylate cyclase (GGDEF)-like protein